MTDCKIDLTGIGGFSRLALFGSTAKRICQPQIRVAARWRADAHPSRRNDMAKGQMRSNREQKKPKQPKKPAAPLPSARGGQARPMPPVIDRKK
jgi:hypothetical protein